MSIDSVAGFSKVACMIDCVCLYVSGTLRVPLKFGLVLWNCGGRFLFLLLWRRRNNLECGWLAIAFQNGLFCESASHFEKVGRFAKRWQAFALQRLPPPKLEQNKGQNRLHSFGKVVRFLAACAPHAALQRHTECA
jgi:hypothetical protein